MILSEDSLPVTAKESFLKVQIIYKMCPLRVGMRVFLGFFFIPSAQYQKGKFQFQKK